MKRTLLALLVGLLALGLPQLRAAAGGNGAQTETIHFDGTDEPFELGEPTCGLPADAVVFQAFSGVIHTTEGPNGQLHATSRFQGSITVVVPGGQTYVGHYADHDTEHFDPRDGTFTLVVGTSNNVVRAPDGATVGFHFRFRLVVDPSGEVLRVDRFRLTCSGSA